jgi:hypothetical protein
VKETKRISHAQGDVEGKFVAHLMLEVLSWSNMEVADKLKELGWYV